MEKFIEFKLAHEDDFPKPVVVDLEGLSSKNIFTYPAQGVNAKIALKIPEEYEDDLYKYSFSFGIKVFRLTDFEVEDKSNDNSIISIGGLSVHDSYTGIIEVAMDYECGIASFYELGVTFRFGGF